MEVYLVEDDHLKRIQESDFVAEADLEKRLVRTDGATVGGIEVLYIGRQGSPGEAGVFDILGVDERGDTVVVELKRDQAPRDIVTQALEYASEIRNVGYEYLEEQYRDFVWDEQGYSDLAEVPSLREAHAAYFDLDKPILERDFNDDQHLIVVGTTFQDLSLKMADFLREHGIDVVVVEYSTYRAAEAGIELLTTDGVRRPLSEEPTTGSGRSEKIDYSTLVRNVRDRVYSEVAEITRHEAPEEMSSSSTRQFEFSSEHSDHPDTVRYRFKPRIVEDGRAVVSIDLWGTDDKEKDRVREIVSVHADELDGFEKSNEHQPNNNLVKIEFEMADREPDNKFVDAVVEEMVRLIEFYHPKLVEGAGQEDG